MRRMHRMPFGCEPLPGGGVRFRLWAPAASRPRLCLTHDGQEEVLRMQTRPNGWFELEAERARAGDRYCFMLDDGLRVPDPASRSNADDVHGPSVVVDPLAFDWQDDDWRGRPWEQAVIYEVHVGTFTPEGTFAGVQRRLEYLADLGVTAIELMPVADFPGRRNWGYDGVLLFAPDSVYGTPADLKRLVQSAHRHGLMVLLDVVYNHFGPDGNYLHLYAPQFFTERHHTPWGAAINMDGVYSSTVRDFYVNNALYWLEEYRFDGLRLDAVHAILDDSQPHFVTELAKTVRAGIGSQRHVHLVIENDDNATRFLGDAPGAATGYDAQWNDDVHHAMHALITGESDGYYLDYAERPGRHLARALAEGFAFQGEPSAHRGGRKRGEPSARLRPTAFVSFLQNHDQVSNSAHGKRIGQVAQPGPLRSATAILLLAPQIPLLFMGEEWGATTPFPFFGDFQGGLAALVREGRRNELARFERFRDQAAHLLIPDPGADVTFESARLNWEERSAPQHATWLALYRMLLHIRAREIAPRLSGTAGGARYLETAPGLLQVDWTLGDRSRLHLLANLSPEARECEAQPPGQVLYTTEPDIDPALCGEALPAWTVAWTLERASG